MLEAANQSAGDWQAFENAVYEQYFRSADRNESNSRKLANNTKLGMAAYRIIKGTKDTRLTDFGEELHALRDDEEKLYRHLAKHILLNLHGLTMIETIKGRPAARLLILGILGNGWKKGASTFREVASIPA